MEVEEKEGSDSEWYVFFCFCEMTGRGQDSLIQRSGMGGKAGGSSGCYGGVWLAQLT